MNLTVTARIAGGFALVVLLTLAISATGLIGLISIQKSLLNVTELALPISHEISNLESRALTSQINLKDFLQQTRSNDLAAIETAYNNNVKAIRQHLEQVEKLAVELPDIAKEVKNLDSPLNTIQNEGEKALQAYRDSILLGEAIAKKKRQIGDAADELLSLTGGIRASNAALAGNVDDFNRDLDKLIETIFTAQGKTIPAAVKAADKRISKDLANLQTKLSTLGQTSDSTIGKTFSALQQNLTGDNGFLAGRVKQLELERGAKTAVIIVFRTEEKLFENLKATKNLIDKSSHNAGENAEQSVSSSRNWMISLSIIALILSAIISLLLINNIRSGLNNIVDYIRIIASGDLRSNINVTSQDELGILAAGTHDLVVKLRHILGEINKSSQQLAATAEETSSISSLGLSNIVKQKEQTDMIATAIAEMSATVNEVAQNVNLTLHSIESAYKQITNGQHELENNIHNIRHLASGIDQSTTVITRVSEYSDNIGSILDVIRGIAEQTNLLALNAAIEAARAGEQGRGFAVVADEVRTLASRTQTSTTEIQDMIQRLQSGVHDAVNVMTTSRDEANITVMKIAETGEMLERISQAMNAIKDMSTQIASATEEQAAATQEQHRNVETISQMAEQTASGARDSNQASHELARMAETLRSLISQFRI